MASSATEENTKHVSTDVPTVLSSESTLSISKTPTPTIEFEKIETASSSSKEPSYSLTFILNLLKVIRESIKDDPAASIDWEKVRLSIKKEETNPFEMSSSDCRNLWKKLAYGEKCTEGDSDEVCLFIFFTILGHMKALSIFLSGLPFRLPVEGS